MAEASKDIPVGRNGQRPLSEALGVSFWLALLWLAVVFALALTAGCWALPPYDRMHWDHPAAPPGTVSLLPDQGGDESAGPVQFVHILGTDTMGRDILTRLIFGARVSLAVGLLTPLIGLIVGGTLGMLAGFYRGALETVVGVMVDAILAFPGIVLLLAITFYLGQGLINIIIALAVLTIPVFIRVARASTLKFSQQAFVHSARMLGQGDMSILLREILPNIILPLVVYGLLVVAYMIVAEGALSFIGLGVPAPTPSWGGMIAEGKEVLSLAPHVSLLPSLVMFVTVLSFNLIGDRLRAIIDFRQGQL
ncbi:peptide ABC transporter, permease protein [Desulfosarcina variabilis str. Montpellier]|uniref:ABC transporter permease n=1 Tax=Desulfosarcina variabilis TaxID=2300 RepID=UPI003AFA22C7